MPTARAVLGILMLPALSALPPHVYQQARDEAALHLYVQIVEAERPKAFPGVCWVEGKVVRVLRDRTSGLEKETLVRFPAPCTGPGARPMAGPAKWIPVSRMAPGMYLDGYFNVPGQAGKGQQTLPEVGEGPVELQVATWNIRAIDESQLDSAPEQGQGGSDKTEASPIEDRLVPSEEPEKPEKPEKPETVAPRPEATKGSQSAPRAAPPDGSHGCN